MLCGILFVPCTGIQWEWLPQELGFGSGMTCWRRLRDRNAAGAWRRLQEVLLDGFFARWPAAGVFTLIRGQLRRRIRRAMGMSLNPVAAVSDSQSVKGAVIVPRGTSGYDAGRRRRAGRGT